MMRSTRNISLALALVGLSAAAHATVLTSDRVAIGVANDGSLGDIDAELGIRFDPDGPGGVPGSGDVLLPGRAWEVWSLSFGAETRSSFEFGSPDSESWLDITWLGPIETVTLHGMRGTASTESFDLELQVALSRTTDVLWIEITLTARAPMQDLWVSRSIDLDLDAAFGTYETDNRAGDGFASSASTREERAVAIAADGRGTICSDWCASADDVRQPSQTDGVADSPIGIAVSLGDLSIGDVASARFVYGFGPSSEGALTVASEALLSSDLDADGIESDVDCDDLDPRRAPGLDEVADGLDNDCDGLVDEETSATDDDGDGFSEADGDCDDSEPTAWPGAPPAAGVRDADCDGLADEGWTADTGPGHESDGGDVRGADARAADSRFGDLVDVASSSPNFADSSGCASADGQPLAPLPAFLSCLWALLLWRRR